MNSTRYHTLDHWRGIACLMVVVWHAFPSAAWEHFGKRYGFIPQLGQVGVGMFFAISGYCVTAAVWSSRNRGDGFAAYMKRRFRRIYPPFWIATLLVMAVAFASTQLGRPLGFNRVPTNWSPWELVGNITLTEVWRANIGGPPSDLYLRVAWTLCFEEQFYLICGVLLMFSPRAYLPATLLICVATAGYVIAHELHWVDVFGIFLDAHWAGFAAGIFMFYAIHGGPLEKRFSLAALVAGAIMTAMIPLNGPFLHERTSVLFAALALCMYRWDGALMRSRLLRPLGWCGMISYSIYLIHVIMCIPAEKLQGDIVPSMPVAIAIAAGAILGSIAIAWPFHCFFERPFMSSSQRKNDQRIPPVATDGQSA